MHNISLPRHRYVWVVPEFVIQSEVHDENLMPAVWYGVSVQPGRVMGCHVLLESGATVIDLPLHALRSTPTSGHVKWRVENAHRWDGFGWNAEIFEPIYLTGLSARILTENHQLTDRIGDLWFCIDHINDGYSIEPTQHKHLWVVALENGCFTQVPQDMLLIKEASFTNITVVPKIKRQDKVWTTE
jgi:hypothetical protein